MKRILLVIITLFIMTTVACAQDTLTQQLQGIDSDKIENSLNGDAQDILDGFSITDALEPKEGLQRLYDGFLRGFDDIFRSGLRNACTILAVVILCSVVTVSFSKTDKICAVVGVMAVAAISIDNVNSFVGLGKQTLDDMQTFSAMLLPTLSASAAACGAVASAGAKYAGAVLFMNVLMNLSVKVILPAIYAYTAAGIGASAMDSEGLKSAASLLEWAARTMMRTLVIIFVTYITLTGVISGATDAATVKMAKTAISTALPVVGSIISDAADTVLSGAEIIKNTLGVFALIATAAICLMPFLRLGVNYLLYKICAALTVSIADKSLSGAVNTVSTAFGMILGLVGTGAIMMFLSVISFMKAVV